MTYIYIYIWIYIYIYTYVYISSSKWYFKGNFEYELNFGLPNEHLDPAGFSLGNSAPLLRVIFSRWNCCGDGTLHHHITFVHIMNSIISIYIYIYVPFGKLIWLTTLSITTIPHPLKPSPVRPALTICWQPIDCLLPSTSRPTSLWDIARWGLVRHIILETGLHDGYRAFWADAPRPQGCITSTFPYVGLATSSLAQRLWNLDGTDHLRAHELFCFVLLALL